MKIYIQTFTGEAETYEFNVDPSTSIEQLKQLYLKESKDTQTLENICFIFRNSKLNDNKKTLQDYDVIDGAILKMVELNLNGRGDIGGTGADFADVSKNEALSRREWNKAAPPWRRTGHGLCLEGICTKKGCKAENQCVIIPIGYKKFDIVGDPDENTTVCPLCKTFVNPKTSSFNNCWWRYEGKKENTLEKDKPPVVCSSDWKYADNAYHYFDEQASGIVRWKRLIIEAVKDKPN